MCIVTDRVERAPVFPPVSKLLFSLKPCFSQNGAFARTLPLGMTGWSRSSKPYTFPGVCSADKPDLQRSNGKQDRHKESRSNQDCGHGTTRQPKDASIASQLISLLFLTMSCDGVTNKCVGGKTPVMWCDDMNVPVCGMREMGERHCDIDGESKKCNPESSFLVDSGAAKHCSGDKSRFKSMVYGNFGCIQVANGEIIPVTAKGEVDITVQGRVITLRNVFYVPQLAFNVISVKRLWKDNRIATKFGDKCYLKDKNTGEKYHFPGKLGSLYRIGFVGSAKITETLLHRRLGHCGINRLRAVHAHCNGVPTVKANAPYVPKDCDACLRGGAIHKPFSFANGKRKTYAKQLPTEKNNEHKLFGEYVSSDLLGPLPKSVFHKYTYAIVFHDAATKLISTYYLKDKSAGAVMDALIAFQRDNKAKLEWNNGNIKTWHTDNGGEFTSTSLKAFCDLLAIRRGYSTPWVPQQNALAERSWGSLLRIMRVILAESKVPEEFWVYAMENAVLVHNCLPCSANPGWKSPHEMQTGTKADISKLRVWGAKCYYVLPRRDLESKLSPRAVPAVHLGRDPRRNGYIIFIPHLNRITTAYHLAFGTEDKFIDPRSQTDGYISGYMRASTKYEEERDKTGQVIPNRAPHDPNYQHFTDEGSRFADDHCSDRHCTFGRHPPDTPHSYEVFDGPEGVPSNRTRGGIARARNARVAGVEALQKHLTFTDVLDEAIVTLAIDNDPDFRFCKENATYGLFKVNKGTIPIPKTYEEAMASPFAKQWMEAMDKEMKALEGKGTWDRVSESTVPAGRRVTKSKWVYDIKYKRDGSIDKFKARFVVCGYSQEKGLDFEQTFSATMRATSFRTLVALAAANGMKLEHLDVSNAFTQAPIDSDIWVDCGKGFGFKDGTVLKLKKALYGAKQSSHLWQKTLFAYLLSEGKGKNAKLKFKQCAADACMFTYTDEKGHRLVIGVYVDDIVVAYDDKALLDRFVNEFMSKFESKSLGPLSFFLGIAVDQHEDGSISIHQSQYIRNMGEKFRLGHEGDSILRDTPGSAELFNKIGASQDPGDIARMEELKTQYLQLVGALLYVAVQTRVDVAYQLSVLCKYMSRPSPEAYKAAMQVLLYLVKTADRTLTYSSKIRVPKGCEKYEKEIKGNYGFIAYSDASWGVPNPAYGYMVMIANGPVSYASKTLKSAESSAEAEYAAAYQGVRDIIFVRNLCEDLGFMLKGKLCLAVDNEAAVKIAYNHGVTARNKHFQRVFHLVREEINYQRLCIFHVRTHLQLADFLTKMLDPETFKLNRDRVM